MVGVELVALPGIVCEHYVRLDPPNVHGKFSAQIHCVFEFAVDVIEVDHGRCAQHVCCSRLLASSLTYKI